jgi:hypothetical protein
VPPFEHVGTLLYTHNMTKKARTRKAGRRTQQLNGHSRPQPG